jgi:hypothetical protein
VVDYISSITWAWVLAILSCEFNGAINQIIEHWLNLFAMFGITESSQIVHVRCNEDIVAELMLFKQDHTTS